jgi:hypothetical protein
MLHLVLALSLAASPEVALLSSQGDVAELRFQPLGAAELAAPVVRFSHGEGSPVQGSLLPRTRVVVATAALGARGDLSFSSALIRLEAGKPARVLADQLVYGSRPLVTAEGRVFVARGVAGVEPTDAQQGWRVDALTIDEIHPTTAARRLVYSTRGYLTFLAGSSGRELIVYEVAPSGARLISVQVDTLAVREIVHSMVALARDFVVDAPRHRVLFTQGTPGGDRWFVEQVDLISGASTRLAEGPEITLLPTVLADGRVLISGGPGEGLRALDGKGVLPALGPGFERVQLQQQGLILGLHERPSEFPAVFASKDGKPVRLLAPPESRLDVAGVSP